MRNKKIWVIFALAILIPAIFTGCGNTNADYSASIAQAQKSVPFKIVVPTYLPSNMKNYPISISDPDKGTFQNSTMIGISFSKKGSYNYIMIYEENHLVTQHPGGTDFAYLDINGITVLEEKTSNSSSVVDTYLYGWNQNDINILADMSGNDKTEWRKVVESMVKQN